MLYCPAFQAIALSSKVDDENRVLLSRTRCKSWSCSYCASANRARWRAFLLDVLPAVSEVWSFHTITLPAWIRKRKDWDDADRTIASLSVIRANWDKFMKRLKRQLGAVQYFRCFEIHNDGCLHIHVLISHHIPQKELRVVKRKKGDYSYWVWMKRVLPECGFGYMSSSENLNEEKAAAGYVTKYMTKEDLFYSEMLSKYHIRRFQSSQGIGSQEDWGRGEDAWFLRTFIDGGMIHRQDYFDVNLKMQIKEKMLGSMREYPPKEQYQESDREVERRKRAKA